jgi:hypothetical protein
LVPIYTKLKLELLKEVCISYYLQRACVRKVAFKNAYTFRILKIINK